MSIKHDVGKQLAKHSVGQFSAEIAVIIGTTVNNVSTALTRMLTEGNVTRHGNPARWSLTPKGRAYYSELNDDDTDNKPAHSAPPEPAAIEQPARRPPLAVTLDRDQPIDNAVFNLMQAIAASVDQPTIKDRQAKYQLLDIIAASPLYSDHYHDIAESIKSDLAKLEDAA